MCDVGQDSPIILSRDVSTHTRAVKLKRQALQERLELCVLELKELCIREAVSNLHHLFWLKTHTLLSLLIIQTLIKILIQILIHFLQK